MQPDQDDLQRQLDQEQLMSFVEACSIVNSSLDETKLLYSIVDVSVMLTRCRHGRVFLTDAARPGKLFLRAIKGQRRQGILQEEVPAGAGTAWIVIRGGESIMSNDAAADDRFQWQPATAPQAPIGNVLCVPMLSHENQVVGAIELHDKPGEGFTAQDRYFIELLAHQAGACVTSSNLFAKMREERQWISSVVDSMSDGVVVADPAGNIVLANESARDAFVLGEDFQPAEDDLNLMLLMEEVAKMDDGESFDFVMMKPNAEILSVRTTVQKDSDGSMRSMILGMRNVRELKETERKNREFLSLVSHELDTHYDRIVRKLPEQLAQAGGEVADLISNLVFYSEIEAGPMRLERRVTDIYELVAAACADSTSELTRRGVDFQIEEMRCPPVLVDPERVGILIKGILRYALGQISEGARIRVRFESDRQINDVQIILDVEGLKLTAREINDLFDKTYQVENFISILGRQTAGLSLIFLKHIATAHGGDFHAEPTGPEAVSFRVTLRR